MSSSERLLILGATGQLGTDLVHAAAAAGVDHVGAAHEDIDVTEADSVAAGIARYRPTIVINTAALHRVDACEDDPHKAYLVNTVGALLVARAAARAGARSVYISTDFVFSGDKDRKSTRLNSSHGYISYAVFCLKKKKKLDLLHKNALKPKRGQV